MGKIKTVIMGDMEVEEKAREKERAKREAKKLTKHKEDIDVSPSLQEVEKVETEEIELQKSKKRAVTKKASSTDKYYFAQGKKYAAAVSLIDKNKIYSLSEALELVKKTSYSKFDGTVELHLNVTDKGLRGNVQLPHGTGKQMRIKIADDALVADLEKGGKIDFDVLVSDPAMMPKLAKIAKILGPKGLMPNPKTGTISNEPEKLVKTLSSSASWKTEASFPIIHTVLGKVSFENEKLEENFEALIKSIGKDKIRSAFLKATMGPAIRLGL